MSKRNRRTGDQTDAAFPFGGFANEADHVFRNLDRQSETATPKVYRRSRLSWNPAGKHGFCP